MKPTLGSRFFRRASAELGNSHLGVGREADSLSSWVSHRILHHLSTRRNTSWRIEFGPAGGQCGPYTPGSLRLRGSANPGLRSPTPFGVGGSLAIATLIEFGMHYVPRFSAARLQSLRPLGEGGRRPDEGGGVRLTPLASSHDTKMRRPFPAPRLRACFRGDLPKPSTPSRKSTNA